MREFHYVEGSAAKFWRIERAGAVLTIRYGRLGAAGQTQVKDLGTDAAAAGQADKLVAAKVRKGYTEVAAAATGTAAPPAAPLALPDEDTFVFPPAWRKHLYARRAGRSGAAVKASTDPVGEARRVLNDLWHPILGKLRYADGDPDPDGAARRYLLGARDRYHDDEPVTPLGVAVAVVAANQSGGWHPKYNLPVFADAWIAQHGLVFAARAGAEIGGLTVGEVNHRPAYVRRRHADDKPYDTYSSPEQVMARIRARIAACSDEEYTQVRAALAGYRDGLLRQRVAVSFLVPSETDWVDEDCAAGGDGLLVYSMRTVEQLGDCVDRRGQMPAEKTTTLLATVLDGIGVGCLAPVLRWFDRFVLDDDEYKRLFTLLSHIPTDEAFTALLDRLDKPHAKTLAAKAMQRYPVRALRLLPPVAVGDTAAAPVAAELLTGHAPAHRRYVPAVLPTLRPVARDLLTTLAGPG